MNRRAWNWKEAQLPRNTQEELFSRFELGLYEAALEGDARNLDVLVALGEVCDRRGLIEKGLEVDLRLVQIRPEEATYQYRLACRHSVLGHIDPALQALTRAIQLGYNKIDHLRENPDLDNLKKDRRYQEILRSAGKKLKG
jgi:tetratricopeptide (TPR) repeat protein